MYANYNDLVDFVVTNGERVGPRGKMTTEVLGATLTFPANAYIDRTGGNLRLIAVETMMLLGGFFNIELLKTAAPSANIALFSKQSDYGPRVMAYNNWGRAFANLSADHGTRRGIVYFNDRNQAADDVACTTSMQFFVRQGMLEAFVTMRSWDIVYGLPADVFMFCNLLQKMAHSLLMPASSLTVQVSSLHIYDGMVEKASHKNMSHFLPLWTQPGWNGAFDYQRWAVEIATREHSPLEFWDFYNVDEYPKYIQIGGI